MTKYVPPPGELCDSCGQNIDAREEVVAHAGRFYCDDECRRAEAMGRAEQLSLGGSDA